MSTKVTYDTVNKLIICKAGVIELDVKIDLYSDAKEDWKSNPELNKFKFLFRVIGGDETVPPEKAPFFAYLRYGWRLRPQEASHTLRLKNGSLLVDEDPALDPIVPTLGEYNVLVRDVVPIRGTQLETGISGLTGEESQRLAAIEDVQIETDKIQPEIIAKKNEFKANVDTLAKEDGGRLQDIDTNILDILSNTEFTKDIEGGKWSIVGDEMIFYKADNVTEIMRFTIARDEKGNPIMRTRQ